MQLNRKVMASRYAIEKEYTTAEDGWTAKLEALQESMKHGRQEMLWQRVAYEEQLDKQSAALQIQVSRNVCLPRIWRMMRACVYVYSCLYVCVCMHINVCLRMCVC
jgi:hypothetical protein